MKYPQQRKRVRKDEALWRMCKEKREVLQRKKGKSRTVRAREV